jgi:hypothetical protein
VNEVNKMPEGAQHPDSDDMTEEEVLGVIKRSPKQPDDEQTVEKEKE